MKPGYLRRRLEIVFWIVTIAVMKQLKDKKAIYYAPWLLLVCVCLGIVFMVVSAATTPGAAKVEVWEAGPTQVALTHLEASNGQRNTLVILVDRFEPGEAHLEGMWLVVYYPGRPQVIMLPLYPGSLQGGSLLDKQLSSLFGLEPDGSPTSEFLQAVQSKDFWWDSLFLLDRLSLARLVELAGGVELDGEKMDGEQAVAWLPSARETPQAALVAQAALAHELCEKSPLIFSGDGMVKNLESVFGQTYLTPGLADGIAGWRLPEPASRLFCELPTFRGTSSQEIAQSK